MVLTAISLALLISTPGWSFTCGTFYRAKGPVGQAVYDYLITWSAINDVEWELEHPVEAAGVYEQARAEARRTRMTIALRRMKDEKAQREQALEEMRPGLIAKILERLAQERGMHARIDDVHDLLTPDDWNSWVRPCTGGRY